jgi:hypothetical protein
VKISIVISNHNYGRFLRAAIDSALNQTWGECEVMVVDNGSSDDSEEIIRSYGRRIQPILQDDQGQGSAFNNGFAASSGDVILFLDADDTLEAGCAQLVARRFQKGDAKIHWPMRIIDAQGEFAGRIHPQGELSQGDFLAETIANGPDTYHWPPTSGNAWSREFLQQVLPMPREEFRISSDLYIASLAPLFGYIRRIDEPLSTWRHHGGNHSWNTTFEARLNGLVKRFDCVSRVMRDVCERRSVKVDMQRWLKNSWCHQVVESLNEIDTTIPKDAGFVLIDGNDWGGDRKLLGRRCYRFAESEGEYAGMPDDNDAAAVELERRRRDGAHFVVMTESAAWMLEHYPSLVSLLGAAKPLLHNERIRIYAMR